MLMLFNHSRKYKIITQFNYSSGVGKEKVEHISTTCTQKAILALGSSILGLIDPTKGQYIATLGETTGGEALKVIHKKMSEDVVGKRILEERPYINSETLDMEALSKYPTNTFGYHYYVFMSQRHFSADERERVKFVDSEELVYVMQRYREVHDFWHVLSGLDTTVLDELGLKTLEYLQTGLPMCAISALFGPIRLSLHEKYLFLAYYIPWALKTNQSVPFLMNIYYEDLLMEDLETLKVKLGFRVSLRE